MVSRITGSILLIYVVSIFLSIVARYPFTQWDFVKEAYSSISSNEELHVLDIVTFGSVSSFLGGVWIVVSFYCRIVYHFFESNDSIESSVGMYQLETRQFLTTIFITIAGICYLMLYAQVHGESPFSSFSCFLYPQSPGLRMLQWWVCGLSISIVVSSISIPSERLFECHPDQSNRFFGSRLFASQL